MDSAIVWYVRVLLVFALGSAIYFNGFYKSEMIKALFQAVFRGDCQQYAKLRRMQRGVPMPLAIVLYLLSGFWIVWSLVFLIKNLWAK